MILFFHAGFGNSGEINGGGTVAVVYREGSCQFPRGVDFSREDVDHRVAPFLAGLPCQQDGVGEVAPGGGFDNPGDVEDDDGFLALARKASETFLMRSFSVG